MQFTLSKKRANQLCERRFGITETLSFIGDVIVEGNDSLRFIYFETDIGVKNYKRYHMVVTDSYYISIHWYETNVIDSINGYNIASLVERFKEDLTYLLKNAHLQS